MEFNELEKIKQKLIKNDIKDNSKVNLKNFISEEKIAEIRNQFFDSGAQNWYDIISKFTYNTYFLDLPKRLAKILIEEHLFYIKNENKFSDDLFTDKNGGQEKNNLFLQIIEHISNILQKNKFSKFFIKLSTRSPKDSDIIKTRAKEEFLRLYDPEIHKNYEEKIILFSQCIQNNFYVSSPLEGLQLLISSERVFEDLSYALEKESEYDLFDMKIVIREWQEPIPIQNEFRGFVWNKNLNALGQYHHLFYFKDLAENKDLLEEIKYNIDIFYNENLKFYLPDTIKHCMVDFAYYDKDNIKIIEINPFDGCALGGFSGSTGLFLLNNLEDKNIVENGPLTLRVKESYSKEEELKKKVAKSWSDAVKSIV